MAELSDTVRNTVSTVDCMLQMWEETACRVVVSCLHIEHCVHIYGNLDTVRLFCSKLVCSGSIPLSFSHHVASTKRMNLHICWQKK
jgi:hypothetical protein